MANFQPFGTGGDAENPRRFANLEASDLDELLEAAHSKRTKYSNAFAVSVSVYKEWALQRNISKELHEQSEEELDQNLRVFYAEVRNKTGENYGKSTLLGLRSGIERHLNYPPHNRGIKFSKNPAFMKSNMILDAKIKNLKQLGKQNTKHKPAITTPDLQKLRVHPVLFA
ncbi:Hypothetical predicted protein [Paramuricea clavata]|uniref:Uncharacterized protein n=1 Tax=Paramuricea clavata TaxID=317549 RepID=A0A6S7IWP4_PARCT|nr:Hypothetical predicted protein [Paramuricea clavata]